MTTDQQPPQPQQQKPTINDRLLNRIGQMSAEHAAQVVQYEHLLGEYQETSAQAIAERDTVIEQRDALRKEVATLREALEGRDAVAEGTLPTNDANRGN